MVLLTIITAVITPLIEMILAAAAGGMLATIGSLIWTGISGAVVAMAVIATYHELRMAKEGPDIGQVAAVFD